MAAVETKKVKAKKKLPMVILPPGVKDKSSNLTAKEKAKIEGKMKRQPLEGNLKNVLDFLIDEGKIKSHDKILLLYRNGKPACPSPCWCCKSREYVCVTWYGDGDGDGDEQTCVKEHIVEDYVNTGGGYWISSEIIYGTTANLALLTETKGYELVDNFGDTLKNYQRQGPVDYTFKKWITDHS